MRAFHVAMTSVFTAWDLAGVARAFKVTATIVATAAVVALASFVAVALSLT